MALAGSWPARPRVKDRDISRTPPQRTRRCCGWSPRAEVVSSDLAAGWEYLALRELLAQLYRRAGRLSEADAVDAELLALLDVADDDHPIKRRLLAREVLRNTREVEIRARH